VKQYFIQAFEGLNTDIPARRLPDQRLSDVSNVMFKDAKVMKRWGFNEMSLSSLSGAVMRIALYESAISNSRVLLVFTEEEAYRYNNETGNFDIITPCYIKGTATCAGSTTAVTGSSTYWRTDWPDDYSNLQIGFGSTDPNSITTWYSVASISSETALTLGENGPAVTGSDYCMKFSFSGDEDDFFSVAFPYDAKAGSGEGDKIAAACNGVESIITYDGSGTANILGYQEANYNATNNTLTVDDTGGLFIGMPVKGVGASIDGNAVILTIDSGTQVTLTTDGSSAGGVNDTIADYPVWFGERRPAKYLGYFGSVGYEHFLSAWISDTTNEPQRIEVGAAGKYPEQFLNDVTGDYGTFYLLYDSNEEIVGMHSLQNRIIIYKEQTITEMWAVPSGTNADPYNFVQDKIRNIGPLSGETVVNYGRFHIFMGWDNFYLFDGINAKPIGDEVIQTIVDDINETYAKRAFAMPLREEKLYVVFIPTGESELPNVCYAYNYVTNAWTKWEFTDGSGNPIYFTAWGRYRKSYSPTWDELYADGTVYNDADMRWVDLIIYENIDRYLLGDSNGNVYEFAPEFDDDNGYGFVSSFTTKDFDMGNPKYTIKVLEAILGMRQQYDDSGTAISSSVRIRASVDFGNTWSEYQTVVINGIDEYIEGIANFYVRGKQVRFEIDNNVSSPPDAFELENLNIGYNDSGIKR
jgi:hypothetical protein